VDKLGVRPTRPAEKPTRLGTISTFMSIPSTPYYPTAQDHTPFSRSPLMPVGTSRIPRRSTSLHLERPKSASAFRDSNPAQPSQCHGATQRNPFSSDTPLSADIPAQLHTPRTRSPPLGSFPFIKPGMKRGYALSEMADLRRRYNTSTDDSSSLFERATLLVTKPILQKADVMDRGIDMLQS
jgi:hypothetical protein